MTYILKFGVHVGLVLFSFIAAYSLRRGLGPDWWMSDPGALFIMQWAVIYGAIAGVFELVFKNERGAWSYASIADIVRLAQVTALTALTFLALIFISNRGITLPRSTLLLSWMISLFALVGVRMGARLLIERTGRGFILGLKLKPSPGGMPLILVGDPSAAAAMMRRHTAGETPDYVPVAIVVRDSNLVGQAIHGVPVIGRYEELESILRSATFQPADRTAVLFLENPITELGLGVELIGRLRMEKRPLLRQPHLVELKAGGDALRSIDLEEFLPREPISLDSTPLEKLFSGKRVLVTGAGGSIGSEICRQLVAQGCSHISLVDNSEFLLFEIDRNLADSYEAISKRALLCDVRDAARLFQIFEEERPQIVFHAAALKHVTLVEQNPREAVLTNVNGTWNVSAAARRSGALQFVLISTDKAVNPTSFMGATKRLAESVLPESTDDLRYCVVRFGNVLGSAGSVIPIFREQIERGGPVTVTHRDVERYFMTIPEAVQLVLHAAVAGSAAPTSRTRKFILEMGKPVKIHELARQMIKLCGLRPDLDISIKFTGLKLGEKLTEELMDTNERPRPLSAGLSELETCGEAVTLTEAHVSHLTQLARFSSAPVVRDAVMGYVAALREGAQPHHEILGNEALSLSGAKHHDTSLAGNIQRDGDDRPGRRLGLSSDMAPDQG